MGSVSDSTHGGLKLQNVVPVVGKEWDDHYTIVG